MPAEYAGGIQVTRPCLVLSFPASPAGSTPCNNLFFEMTSEKLSASSWHPDLRHSEGLVPFNCLTAASPGSKNVSRFCFSSQISVPGGYD